MKTFISTFAMVFSLLGAGIFVGKQQYLYALLFTTVGGIWMFKRDRYLHELGNKKRSQRLFKGLQND